MLLKGTGCVMTASDLTEKARQFNVRLVHVPTRVSVKGVDGDLIGKAKLDHGVDGAVTAQVELCCDGLALAAAYVNEEEWEFVGISPEFESHVVGTSVYLCVSALCLDPDHKKGCFLTLQ
jgi:hypothetical protein